MFRITLKEMFLQILEFRNNENNLSFDNITRDSTLAFRWQTVLLYVFVIKETKSGIFLVNKGKKR